MNTQGAGCALLRGHVAALLTILFWGTTFIATKVLLDSMQPIEILFSRFLLGYIALWIVAPHPMCNVSPRQELHFAAVGFFGIFLYLGRVDKFMGVFQQEYLLHNLRPH